VSTEPVQNSEPDLAESRTRREPTLRTNSMPEDDKRPVPSQPYSRVSRCVSPMAGIHRSVANFGEQSVSQLSVVSERRGSFLGAYRRAVLTVLASDVGRAWSRRQIRDLVCSGGLVPPTPNIPLLRVALKELVERGVIVRAARGFYRAQIRS